MAAVAPTNCGRAPTSSDAARTHSSGCPTPASRAATSRSGGTARRHCSPTSTPPTAPPSTTRRYRSGSSPTATSSASGTPRSSSACTEVAYTRPASLPHRPLPKYRDVADGQSTSPGAASAIATEKEQGAPDAGVGAAAVARRFPSTPVVVHLVGASHPAHRHLRADGRGDGPPWAAVAEFASAQPPAPPQRALSGGGRGRARRHAYHAGQSAGVDRPCRRLDARAHR